jgi:heme exporter protein A
VTPLTLNVSGLGKRFGARLVLQDVSFSAAPGEIVGVAGPNGSGKSTLLHILCGLLRPTRGRVEYSAGGPLTPNQARSRIGFCGPSLQLYDDLSASENLAFFARWRGIPAAVDELLARVGLDPSRKDPLRAYSSGMRQRVKLAWALMHGPSVLLLDEPGANLDDAGRALVAAIVAAHARRGLAVVASNDPDELALCGRVVTVT